MSQTAVSTYERYAEFLDHRISDGQVLSEDTLRYAYFAALLETTDIPQHEVLLEVPHPHLPSKKIDTYVRPSGSRPGRYLEFKYHRVSASTSPKPQKAGDLFKDFCRLAPLVSESSKCTVIYITDTEMAEYFNKHGPSYSSFWSHGAGAEFPFDQDFLLRTTPTFQSRCKEFNAVQVGVGFAATLAKSHHLRVFDVYKPVGVLGAL